MVLLEISLPRHQTPGHRPFIDPDLDHQPQVQSDQAKKQIDLALERFPFLVDFKDNLVPVPVGQEGGDSFHFDVYAVDALRKAKSIVSLDKARRVACFFASWRSSLASSMRQCPRPLGLSFQKKQISRCRRWRMCLCPRGPNLQL